MPVIRFFPAYHSFLAKVGLSLLCLFVLLTIFPNAVSADPVKQEEAFPFTVQLSSPDTIRIDYQIRQNYYLYQKSFHFELQSSVNHIQAVDFSDGIHYQDPHLGQVVIYRNHAQILLKLSQAIQQYPVQIKITSQGCWEGGICYPPVTEIATISQTQTSVKPLDLLKGLTSQKTTPTLDTAPQTIILFNEDNNSSDQIYHHLTKANPLLIAISFLGIGLLLAFTPCILPLLPILSSLIVGQHQQFSSRHTLLLSLAYVFGMALSYTILGVLAGLSGTLLSSALQNKWIMGAFSLLFVVLALSMFDLFNIQLPSSLQTRFHQLATVGGRSGKIGGCFIMGGISSLIIGPCVAPPLAGTLLYISQTGNAYTGALALFSMAIGMGIPLIFIGYSANYLLPKFKPHMVLIKQFFGIILLGVALWIIKPFIDTEIFMLASAALMIFTALLFSPLFHTRSEHRSASKLKSLISILCTCYGLALLAGAFAGSDDLMRPLAVFLKPTSTLSHEKVLHYQSIQSERQLAQAIKQSNKPILVDFYADWCITCKHMEHKTLNTPEIRQELNSFTLLRVDVTNNTIQDQELLKHFNLFGPPAIIFLDSNGKEVKHARVIGFMDKQAFLSRLDLIHQSTSF